MIPVENVRNGKMEKEGESKTFYLVIFESY